MKTDWLNKVQTRLRNEQHAQAPQGLLDDIKNEMRRRGIAPTCRPPRRRKVVALWGVRAASIAAFLAVGLYIVHRMTLPSADKPLVSTIAPSPLAPSSIVSRQPMPHCIAFRPPLGAQGAQLAHSSQRIAGTDRRTTDGNNPFTTPLRHADCAAIASGFARNATAIRSRNPATAQAIYRRFTMEFRHVL